jgi:hypothetical protein
LAPAGGGWWSSTRYQPPLRPGQPCPPGRPAAGHRAIENGLHWSGM